MTTMSLTDTRERPRSTYLLTYLHYYCRYGESESANADADLLGWARMVLQTHKGPSPVSHPHVIHDRHPEMSQTQHIHTSRLPKLACWREPLEIWMPRANSPYGHPLCAPSTNLWHSLMCTWMIHSQPARQCGSMNPACASSIAFN